MAYSSRPTSMLPGAGLRQPASQPSSALSTRIAAKKAELENLRQLRDLSGTLAMQMQALESKIATLKDGTEGQFTFYLSPTEGTQTDSNQRLHACLPIGTMCFAPSAWPLVSFSEEETIAHRTSAVSTNATGFTQPKPVDFTILDPTRRRTPRAKLACQPPWFASRPSPEKRLASETSNDRTQQQSSS